MELLCRFEVKTELPVLQKVEELPCRLLQAVAAPSCQTLVLEEVTGV